MVALVSGCSLLSGKVRKSELCSEFLFYKEGRISFSYKVWLTILKPSSHKSLMFKTSENSS